jgi:hypothetical protein
MILEAYNTKHPEFQDKSVYEVWEEEKPYLRRTQAPFDGYSTEDRRAGVQCLVRFDGNNYSVPCEYAGKLVSIRIYAQRIVVAFEGKTIAEHGRSFEKGGYILEALHYIPLLKRKPGALRNGRPFLNWEIPESVGKVWEVLRRYRDWDRQMSEILSAIPTYGMEAVEVACEMALEANTVSESVIMNYLTRLTEEPKVESVPVPKRLKLREEPSSDCRAYDRLLENSGCCAKTS